MMDSATYDANVQQTQQPPLLDQTESLMLSGIPLQGPEDQARW